MPFRLDINGLRALAVIGVVAFHFRLGPLRAGGFAGVDVFFVISGFLMTQIITGRMDRGRFWEFLAGGICACGTRRAAAIGSQTRIALHYFGLASILLTMLILNTHKGTLSSGTAGFLDPPPKRFVCFDDVCDQSLVVFLFLQHHIVRAWCIRPLSIGCNKRIDMFNLPPSIGANACVALWQAHVQARKEGLPICVVDPENLWPLLWDNRGF